MIKIIKESIANVDTDAIVNAANSHFKMGGGVCCAILCAGINDLNEKAFYKVLEIVEEDRPKAFVLEMDTSVMSKSFCKVLTAA